jgi:hypothetical protein
MLDNLERNDIIFNNQKGTNYLQVIHGVVQWIQLRAFLPPEDQRKDMGTGCNRLLVVTRDLYFHATGWRHSNMIEYG